MTVYRKLVRDKIPEIIMKDKRIPKTRILNDQEYRTELLKKLVEESKEALDSRNNKQDLIKEVGDVKEVLEAIEKAYRLNKKEISILKNERKKKRGGFKKRIFLEKIV